MNIYALVDEDNVVVNYVNWDGHSEPDQFGALRPIDTAGQTVIEGDVYDPVSNTFRRGLPLQIRRRRQQAQSLSDAMNANREFLAIDQPTAGQVRAQTERLTEQYEQVVALIVDMIGG